MKWHVPTAGRLTSVVMLAILSTALFGRVSLAYECRLDGKLRDAGLEDVVRGEYLNGPGVLICNGAKTEKQPKYRVQLKLMGTVAGMDFTGTRDVNITAARIDIADINQIDGDYEIAGTAPQPQNGIKRPASINLRKNSGFNFNVIISGDDSEDLAKRFVGMNIDLQPH